MTRKTSKTYNIESDKYIKESGLQGGKIIAEKLVLGCFVIGIPFLIIGLYAFASILFGLGFPVNLANIIAVFLVCIIGFLLIIAGITLHTQRHTKSSKETTENCEMKK